MSDAAAVTADGMIVEGAKEKGHPKGLYFLFFTEMWERFSYYGMRSILVFYMIKQLLYAQASASHIYGIYTGLVYFTPFFGGIIADRWLGQRKAVIVGGVLMAFGHFTLAFESLFFLGLALIILGCGFFKPNISTQVGGLYKQGDHRRDRAFSIFYMGINLGAFFSPLVCGTLGELYGWHYGFGAAGVGMIAGLIVYLCGQKYLAPDNIMKEKSGEVKKTHEPLTQDDKRKIWALVVLALLNVVFWGVYEQQGNTMALWMDANTDRMILGWEMPASWFQAFNPAMIFILIPLINQFWSWQARRGKEPTSIAKMAYGCIILGASFFIMIPGTWAYAREGSASMMWLVMCTFVYTLGEIYLSPVGLSLVTKLAPARMVSMLMGTWFLAMFLGNYLSGFLGTFWEKMPKETFFLMLAALAIGAGVVMLVLIHPLKKAIGHGHEETVDV